MERNTYIGILILVICNLIDYSYSDEVKCTLFEKQSMIETEDTFKLLYTYMDMLKNHLALAEKTNKNLPPSKIEQYKQGFHEDDYYLNASGLITKYGFPSEEHKVVTEDGYILTVFRIPSSGYPVLVMPGAMSSSDDWLTTGPGSGLGFLLAKAGFDVWLGNNRGNKYAREHVNLTTKCAEFWDFSWDECGRYDQPAIIDHILETTKQEALYYVAHSQGTTGFFVMASEFPEYNSKIKLMISLSSVAWMSHVENPLLHIFADYCDEMLALARQLGVLSIDGNDPISLFFKHEFCGDSESATINCMLPIFANLGFDFGQIDYSRLAIIQNHMTSGESVKELTHFGQEIKSGKFRRFDYGPEENMVRYGNVEPPDYPIQNITAPVVIFYSLNDFMSNFIDVHNLVVGLPNVVEMYRVPWTTFDHFDYQFSKDIKALINVKIIRLLREHQ